MGTTTTTITASGSVTVDRSARDRTATDAVCGLFRRSSLVDLQNAATARRRSCGRRATMWSIAGAWAATGDCWRAGNTGALLRLMAAEYLRNWQKQAPLRSPGIVRNRGRGENIFVHCKPGKIDFTWTGIRAGRNLRVAVIRRASFFCNGANGMVEPSVDFREQFKEQRAAAGVLPSQREHRRPGQGMVEVGRVCKKFREGVMGAVSERTDRSAVARFIQWKAVIHDGGPEMN